MIVVTLTASLVMGLVLGILGGGGSILTLPILMHAAGLEAKVAIATSLLVVAVTSGVGSVQHFRAGTLEIRLGLVFAAFAMAGAYVGGRLAVFVPELVLITAFIAMMLVTAVFMLRSRRATPTRTSASGGFSLPLVALEGLAVGAFTGMVGAGGGFLVVPALVVLGGLSMKRAVGTSLMVISLKSFAGLAGYLEHVQLDLGVALPVTALAVLGALLGHRWSQRLSPQKLKRGFGGFLVLMAVYMGFRELQSATLLDGLGSSPVQWLAAIVVAAVALTFLYRKAGPARAGHVPAGTLPLSATKGMSS